MQQGDSITYREMVYIEALEEVWYAASDVAEDEAPSGAQWSRLVRAMVAAEKARDKAGA